MPRKENQSPSKKLVLAPDSHYYSKNTLFWGMGWVSATIVDYFFLCRRLRCSEHMLGGTGDMPHTGSPQTTSTLLCFPFANALINFQQTFQITDYMMFPCRDRQLGKNQCHDQKWFVMIKYECALYIRTKAPRKLCQYLVSTRHI